MVDIDYSQYTLAYNRFHKAIGNYNPLIPEFELGLEFYGFSLLVQFLTAADNDWSHGGILKQIIPHELFLPSNYSERFVTLASDKIELNRIQPFKVRPISPYQLQFHPSAYIDAFTLRIWQYTGEGDPFFPQIESGEFPTLEELGGINLDRLAIPLGIATLGEDGILLESQRPPLPEPEESTSGGGGGGIVLDSGWIDLQLQNNFVPYGTDSAGPMQLPQYRKIGNFVRLQGCVRGGNNEAIIAVLPEGFRPTSRHVFPVQAGGGLGHIQIRADGRITPYAPNPNAFLSLESNWLTSDPVQAYQPMLNPIGSWQPLQLVSNWRPVGTDYGDNYRDPRYRKNYDNMVQLAGIARAGNTGGGFIPIAQMPVGYRPIKREILWINNSNRPTRIDIEPNGVMSALDLFSSEFISFEGQYPTD